MEEEDECGTGRLLCTLGRQWRRRLDQRGGKNPDDDNNNIYIEKGYLER